LWPAARPEHAPIDRQSAAALLCAAIVITLLWYGAAPAKLIEWFPALRDPTWGALPAWAVRVGLRLVLYVAVPLLLARRYGLGFADLGLGRGATPWRLYALLFAAVLLPMVGISFTAPFQRAYPQYKLLDASAAHLTLWLTVYGISFFTVEFFYRGFLLAMLRPRFGETAVFVALIPYVMIHFPKPPAETLGSVLTGSVLGLLAMRTRSIWGGFALHVAVAYTMDALAIAHRHWH
jgi:membrane protease YdiL (CAAX protease family)